MQTLDNIQENRTSNVNETGNIIVNNISRRQTIYRFLQMYNLCLKSWYNYDLFYTLMIWMFLGLLANIVELRRFISASNQFTTVLQPQLALNLFLIFHKF